MDLFIFGSNSRLFPQLNLAVSTLRDVGEYKDKIVVCDNECGKNRQTGQFLMNGSFTNKQKKILESYNCDVVTLNDLIREHPDTCRNWREIPTKHSAYPNKIIYCFLISQKYLTKVDRIFFSDCDVVFQNTVDPILSAVNSDNLYIQSEGITNDEHPALRNWINEFMLISEEVSHNQLRDCLLKSSAYCSGFMGAKAEIFFRFLTLAFVVMDNTRNVLINDQPLVNVLISYFKFPIQSWGENDVVHLMHVNNNDVHWDSSSKKLQVHNSLPAFIHFNGKRTKVFYDLLLSDRDVEQVFEALAKRKHAERDTSGTFRGRLGSIKRRLKKISERIFRATFFRNSRPRFL